MAEHTWYITDSQRYCTTCGAVQTADSSVHPMRWSPEVTCPGGTPSSAADMLGGEGVRQAETQEAEALERR
jgi:pyrroline-5-carboxylate reductase